MTPDPCRHRRDLCRTLHGLSDRQQAALDAGDDESLIGVLQEKQAILDRLPAAQAAARDWAAGPLSFAERAAAQAWLAEGDRLLAELAGIETAAVATLTARRDATATALRDLSTAGRVHAAYRDALAPATHRSLDVGS